MPETFIITKFDASIEDTFPVICFLFIHRIKVNVAFPPSAPLLRKFFMNCLVDRFLKIYKQVHSEVSFYMSEILLILLIYRDYLNFDSELIRITHSVTFINTNLYGYCTLRYEINENCCSLRKFLIKFLLLSLFSFLFLFENLETHPRWNVCRFIRRLFYYFIIIYR